MPSRSEGWGGLFKDEQYRLIRSASRASIRWLRDFEQTTPALRAFPSLLRRGIVAAVIATSSTSDPMPQMQNQQDKIKTSFTRQASQFADPRLTLSNAKYLKWIT